MRIAASILLTGLLILFFKNKENKTETILISKAVLNNQKPILKKNISSEQIANPSLETTKLKTSPLKKSVKSKNLLLNEEVTITQNSEPKTDTAPKEESVAQIEEQQQPFQKRKKARYIQLDFDDSETVHKTVPVPSFYSSNFQIKFLKQSPPDEVGMHEQSENKPLRIKL